MPYKKGNLYWIKVTHNGQTIQGSTGIKKLRDAQAYEDAFRTALRKGDVGLFDHQNAPTLSQFRERFETYLPPRVKPRTVAFYKDYMKPLIGFEPMANAKLHQIDPVLIDQLCSTGWLRMLP